MSVMTKLYILLYCLAALVFAVGGGYIIRKKRRDIPHDCRSCAHCTLIERGADGKLIYTCGIDRGNEPKVYYERAIPVYCGWWNRWKEKPVPTSALYDRAEKMVGLLQEELDLFHAERVRAKEKAKILTVTELRKMEGEPVFLKSKGEDFKDGWSIITSVYREEICFQPTYKKLKIEDYGKTWLACRGEPEEEIENG